MLASPGDYEDSSPGRDYPAAMEQGWITSEEMAGSNEVAASRPERAGVIRAKLARKATIVHLYG